VYLYRKAKDFAAQVDELNKLLSSSCPVSDAGLVVIHESIMDLYSLIAGTRDPLTIL